MPEQTITAPTVDHSRPCPTCLAPAGVPCYIPPSGENVQGSHPARITSGRATSTTTNGTTHDRTAFYDGERETANPYLVLPACASCEAAADELGVADDPDMAGNDGTRWEQEYERVERVRVAIATVAVHLDGTADFVEKGWPEDSYPVEGSEQHIAASVPAAHRRGLPLMRWRPVLRCGDCGESYRVEFERRADGVPVLRLDRLTEAQTTALDFDRGTRPVLADLPA